MSLCACGCGQEFEPRKGGKPQRFLARHREAYSKPMRLSPRERRKVIAARQATVTVARRAKPALRTILWEKGGSFSRTREPGARWVLKVDEVGIMRRVRLLKRGAAASAAPSRSEAFPRPQVQPQGARIEQEIRI